MKGVLEEIELDFDRRHRTGLDETIFAQGKSAAQLEAILTIAQSRSAPLLITRLTADKYATLARRWVNELDYCPVSGSAFFGVLNPVKGRLAVAIVAGGSSDAAVAREAQRTLMFNGIASRLYMDVGVAGLWRLTSRIDAIREFAVVIAIAGMDAALPTVLGGLIPSVIIAVPTSVGYGVVEGGRTALNALLASCASGITVVNIDNGYGAACAAVRALRVTDHARNHGAQCSSLPDTDVRNEVIL